MGTRITPEQSARITESMDQLNKVLDEFGTRLNTLGTNLLAILEEINKENN